VSADDDVNLPLGQFGYDVPLFGGRSKARQHFDADRPLFKAREKIFVVLKSENCCRHKNCDLLTVEYRFECGAHRHFGFPVADVAANQAIGWRIFLHVLESLFDCAQLVGGFVKRERGLKFFERMVWGRERKAPFDFSGGVNF